MTVSEVKELITRKNYLFEVASESAGKSYGKQTLDSVKELHDNFETYLTVIARAQKKNTLGIQLFQKNGTSTIKREFFLVNITPVVEPTNTVDKSTNQIAASTQNVEQEQKKLTKMSEVTKADIENAQMKTEIQFLNRELATLKEANKKLDQRNDSLFTENNKLSRELGNEKERLSLEYQKKEVELHSKQAQGLNGIVEGIKTLPPEAWTLLNGLLLKGQAPQQQLPAPPVNGTQKRHADPDTQCCIDMVNDLLVTKEPAVVGMIASLADYFAKYPDHLAITFKKFFPEQTVQTPQ